jgi:hypothetical protein
VRRLTGRTRGSESALSEPFRAGRDAPGIARNSDMARDCRFPRSPVAEQQDDLPAGSRASTIIRCDGVRIQPGKITSN